MIKKYIIASAGCILSILLIVVSKFLIETMLELDSLKGIGSILLLLSDNNFIIVTSLILVGISTALMSYGVALSGLSSHCVEVNNILENITPNTPLIGNIEDIFKKQDPNNLKSVEIELSNIYTKSPTINSAKILYA